MIPRRIDFGVLLPLLGMVLILALLPGANSGALAIAVWVFTIGYILGCIEPVKPLKAGKYPGRRIVCAAMRCGDDVYLGVRHLDEFMVEKWDAIHPKSPIEEQGFIDQHGEFLTREEAYDVAKAAGQIIRRCGGDEGRLYSENLY